MVHCSLLLKRMFLGSLLPLQLKCFYHTEVIYLIFLIIRATP